LHWVDALLLLPSPQHLDSDADDTDTDSMLSWLSTGDGKGIGSCHETT
jgi:hypothetical protein